MKVSDTVHRITGATCDRAPRNWDLRGIEMHRVLKTQHSKTLVEIDWPVVRRKPILEPLRIRFGSLREICDGRRKRESKREPDCSG